MGQSVVKNPKKLYSQLGGDSTLPTRVTNLENNEYKVTYYEIISGTSGSLTVPTGATINQGEFGLSGDSILSKIDGSNNPTFESPKTLGGVIVTSNLNTTTGAWNTSGTYTDSSVALIYSIKIKAIDYSNLTYDNIIETVSIGGSTIIGASQIAFGDPSGVITSSSLFNRDSSTGNITIGATSSVGTKLYILQNTVSTGAKGISVNFNTIGEVFSIDDNAIVNFVPTTFNIKGSGSMNIVAPGANPYTRYMYNTSLKSGDLLGNGQDMFMNATRNFGVGSTFFVPLATTHIGGVDPTTNINLRLEPVTNVTEDTTGGTVNTTNATANVTAQTIVIPNNKVCSLESTIIYRKTGGAGVGTIGDGTVIKLNSSVKNVGGTLTLDTIQNSYTGTINAIIGVSATYTISGSNILVSVTGVANDNITWNAITKINTVG